MLMEKRMIGLGKLVWWVEGLWLRLEIGLCE
jgi:hypothetical protein